MKKVRGIFDEDNRLIKLSGLRDPLVKLSTHVDFEIFRPLLNKIPSKKKEKSVGRPAYDSVLMFKILILQRLYNLSDEQTEYQLLDRLSFMRFTGLELCDTIPDRNTIWNFREKLISSHLVEELFNFFYSKIEEADLIMNEGEIVDASFVEVPRQRNSRDENKGIKEGNPPKEWDENPHKKCQKDMDARWTKKNNQPFYGYKNHINIDAKSKLIKCYTVTDASVHDSQVVDILTHEKSKKEEFYADSAYRSVEIEKLLKEKNYTSMIHEKAYKNKALTDFQKAFNTIKSKVRVRVEHIFGFIQTSMNGSFLKPIGQNRIECQIGLVSLVYNMCRFGQISSVKIG
jgi:IS5 family transposase